MTYQTQETREVGDAMRARFNRRAGTKKALKAWLVYAVFVVSISAIAGMVMFSQGPR